MHLLGTYHAPGRHLFSHGANGLVQQSPTFLVPETSYMEDTFSVNGGGVVVDRFGMIQVVYIYCALYFYYYYIVIYNEIIIQSLPQIIDPSLVQFTLAFVLL